ncbi:uncharacterized protein LOC141667007 isoform X1 [Apium graveolens]|uniref:uncharacterized protein LOC141667007 isoform X1 n=1 Tax=Apium graveolens TaxID=4045 RepID=UPI003D7B990E
MQKGYRTLRELRGTFGNIGQLEEPTTCHKCKCGVEHRYCTRNHSRSSKSVADHDMASPPNNIPVDSSCPSKHVEQSHPIRSENTENDTSLKKAKGVEFSREAEPKNLSAENDVHTVEGTFPSNCSPVPSWMGTFRLKYEKTASIYLGAHPTLHALPKVKEYSENIPKVLEFEPCLYADFLRTAFKGCDPGEGDMGFYFFPDNKNRLDEYIFLMEQLSDQFFLRSCIDEVDLLVFSSKVLHKDYSEWYRHDFLWGMFRHRHGKLRNAMEEKVGEDVNIDDVDIVGGDLVGQVDVVIPMQSSVSNSARIPRDFDLNVVPRDFDLNDIMPEPMSNSNSAEVPRIDSNMNDISQDGG